MQLLHFALPANVVHQKVGVAFAPNESHNTSFSCRALPNALHGYKLRCCYVVYGWSTTRAIVRKVGVVCTVSYPSLLVAAYSRSRVVRRLPGDSHLRIVA